MDLSSSSQSVTELFARFPVSTVHNALNKYKGIGCSSMISSQLSRPHGFESRHPPKKCFKIVPKIINLVLPFCRLVDLSVDPWYFILYIVREFNEYKRKEEEKNNADLHL